MNSKTTGPLQRHRDVQLSMLRRDLLIHHFFSLNIFNYTLLFQEFKTMMQQSSELRNKLEMAVKASQASARRQPPRPVFQLQTSRPTIQLKTDFSDFR